MKSFIPTIHGVIERRILVNFRVQPDVIRKVLPPFFRPKLQRGWAIAGICLIRLKGIRARGFPALFGISSENAAHRIAVEWEENGRLREGVFIPRRDTSSLFQGFVGGRFFPGIHHLAEFRTMEKNDKFQLQMHSTNGDAFVQVNARCASSIPKTSTFSSLDEVSNFFARGSVGYSATGDPACCEGLELKISQWQVEPLDISLVRSSFFDDPKRFPAGTIHFDCALLMRNIEHEWHVLPRMIQPI